MRVLGFADRLKADSRSHARAGGEPFSLPARICEADPPNRARPMKNRSKPKERHEHEPVGIVISDGPMRETTPVFAAYVWGPAPEQTRPTPEPHAA
jgi:hypothetical protein